MYKVVTVLRNNAVNLFDRKLCRDELDDIELQRVRNRMV